MSISALIALALVIAPNLPTPGEQQRRSCYGPVIGFEAGSDRFQTGTMQAMPGLIDHMNGSLWRHGWFVLHPTVRDVSDPASRDLVRKRQRRILRELRRRRIAAARIRFAPINAEFGGSGHEDMFIVESVVPLRIWNQLVPANLVC